MSWLPSPAPAEVRNVWASEIRARSDVHWVTRHEGEFVYRFVRTADGWRFYDYERKIEFKQRVMGW